MERPALTERQNEIYEFIRDSIRNGCSPTVREIGSRFGITSQNGVVCHLTALEKKGYIERETLKSRGIRLTGKKLREAVGELLKHADQQLVAVGVLTAGFKAALAELRKVYKGDAT